MRCVCLCPSLFHALLRSPILNLLSCIPLSFCLSISLLVNPFHNSVINYQCVCLVIHSFICYLFVYTSFHSSICYFICLNTHPPCQNFKLNANPCIHQLYLFTHLSILKHNSVFIQSSFHLDMYSLVYLSTILWYLLCHFLWGVFFSDLNYIV